MTGQYETASRKTGHEPVSVSVRGLLFGAAGLVAIILFSFAVTWWLRSVLAADPAKSPPNIETFDADTVKTPLEPDQRSHRIRSEKEQQAQLNQSEWLDPKHEFARIPIERAMELTVKRYRSTAKEDQP